MGLHYNSETQDYSTPNIRTDKTCFYNTSVLDSFHVGFGQQCSVCDQVVQAINQELKRNGSISTDYLSKNANRGILQKFPFILNPSPMTAFPHFPPEPNECNRQCRPMPSAPRYDDTEEGRRKLYGIAEVGGAQLAIAMRTSDFFIRSANALLNLFGFCSSYVSS